ncbi:MAG: A/G-specific adenine glycosylase, partial [Opitutus sp.]
EAELIKLPGVGPYTAAAITSIAFDEPAACIDGNVVRILARLTADGTKFRDSSTAAKHFAPLAGALLRTTDPGGHNQAMMELGATVCLRRNPRCEACPVRGFCTGARGGEPVAFPRLAPKPIERHSVIRVWCERNGALLLHRQTTNARRLAGIHELPTASHAGLDDSRARRGELLARRRRGISHHVITESIHRAPAPRRRPGPGLVWIPHSRLDTVTHSGPHRRWIGEILAKRGMPLRT